MRVLGIDPGLTRCGVGVVEGRVGRPLTLVDVGVVRTAADQPIEQRLCQSRRGSRSWLDATRPDAVAVERVFSQHNVKHRDGHRPGQRDRPAGRGSPGPPVALHTPSEVKAAVTGNGRADKAQVGAMVTRLFRLDRDSVAGRRRRRTRPGHLSHLARGAPPDRGRAGCASGIRKGSASMIAFVSGRVAALGPHLRSARGGRCRSGAAVHSGHARRAPHRCRGDAAHQHGRP